MMMTPICDNPEHNKMMADDTADISAQEECSYCLEEEYEQKLKEAVKAEWERCAKILQDLIGGCTRLDCEVCDTLKAALAAIRAQPEEKTNDKRHEFCGECNLATGKAGEQDDSLYDNLGRGPYCDDCWAQLFDEIVQAETERCAARLCVHCERGRSRVYPTEQENHASSEILLGWSHRWEDGRFFPCLAHALFDPPAQPEVKDE